MYPASAPWRQLRECAASLPNPLLELGTLQVAELFAHYAACDATAPNQELIALSVAGFHWRQAPNVADLQAAAALPAFERNSTTVSERAHLLSAPL